MTWVRILLAAGLLVFGGWPSAHAEDGRYAATTIVTGTDLRGRPGGMALCLQEVLVKVSGNATLAEDPRVALLARQADQWVTDFSYRDRLSGMPRHDEQGSRDRSFYLTVHFDRGKIDALLGSLGERPWQDPRPPVAPLVRVAGRQSPFMVLAGGEAGRYHREAMAAAADRSGLAVVLPGDADRTAAVPLIGRLDWSDRDHGWIGSWRIDRDGRTYRWQVRGVSFDQAYLNMLRGCLHILSGHGAPRKLAPHGP